MMWRVACWLLTRRTSTGPLIPGDSTSTISTRMNSSRSTARASSAQCDTQNGDALGGEHGCDQPCARRIVLDDEERDVGERLDTVRLTRLIAPAVGLSSRSFGCRVTPDGLAALFGPTETVPGGCEGQANRRRRSIETANPPTTAAEAGVWRRR
jgi:hypothetical protein